MTKDDIRLLFEYDRWANNRILRAASALTPESSRAISAAALFRCEIPWCTLSVASGVGSHIGNPRPTALLFCKICGMKITHFSG